MIPKKQYLVEFTPPELTTKLKLPHEKDNRRLNSAKSPPTHPITKGQCTEYRDALLFFTVVIVRFECRRSKQHRTLKPSYSRRDGTTTRRGR